jgi:hypothetical protein
VLLLMQAAKPQRCTCLATSARLWRESGMPSVAGNSQASALILTTSSGGKSPGPTRAGAFFQACQSLPVEALAPLTYHFAARIQAQGDLVVANALGGHQNHLGSLDLEVR